MMEYNTPMEFMEVLFPVSGVRINVLIPPLVAFVISLFCSTGGISGAFLILPFQMSVLGFTSPAVSATNFVFNIIAIPGGVYRYIREGRMSWPMTAVIIAGTLPGVFLGYYIRVMWLPEPAKFKVFVGCVLLYIGIRLGRDLLKKQKAANPHASSAITRIKTVKATFARVEYEFMGDNYSFGTITLFALALAVGVIGGTYGIGGGAIIAPFLVAVMGLPVYTVAGAALMGTFVTSIAGVGFYSLVPLAQNTSPDWFLGGLFGLGGLGGTYAGARLQRHIPQKAIKIMLMLALCGLSLKYIIGYFLK